jgi:hypothetical protein
LQTLPREVRVAETLLQFQWTVGAPDGTAYRAKACGSPMPDGMWQGWLEFESTDGTDVVRSSRETTQPNRTDTEYWASGLTKVYLEGALRRALEGPVRVPTAIVTPPHYDRPAAATAIAPPPTRESATHSVLDPFSVFEKGEPLLRRQLGALSAWHLVNIIVEYELSDTPAETLNTLPASDLVEVIVAGVREESRRPTRRI